MPLKKVVLVVLAAISTATLLTGCYESDNPILDKGEQSAMAGRFECKSAIDGSKEVRTFSEQKDGFWPFASYRYVDSKGPVTMLKKLQNGLVVAQSTKQKGGFQYLFLEFLDDNSIMLMIPDLMSKGPFVEALSKKFNVDIKSRGETLLLTGDKNRTIQFFGAHDRSIMMAVQKCDRVAAFNKPGSFSETQSASKDKPVAASSASRSSPSPTPSRRSYHYIDDTRPPDAWLALRSEPGQGGPSPIKAQLVNGTLLEVLERRDDGWWRVYVPSIRQEGWVLNRLGNRVWVHCCRTGS